MDRSEGMVEPAWSVLRTAMKGRLTFPQIIIILLMKTITLEYDDDYGNI
jgi:hypothetical protein